MNENIEYYLSSALNFFNAEKNACPCCGCKDGQRVSSKLVFTQLKRCSRCSMMFRTPTTSVSENKSFYQKKYKMGFTSEMPDDVELELLLKTKFKKSKKNYDPYIKVLKAIDPSCSARVLDFGCSWGYGTWQIQDAGFQATGYEISRPRCDYAASKLKINATSESDALESGSFDIFFSAHVLEHVPSVLEAFRLAKKVLKPNGIFVALTPNGSIDFKKVSIERWNKLWGRVHPNLLDDVFYKKNCNEVHLDSPPYDLDRLSKSFDGDVNELKKVKELIGGELLACAKAEHLILDNLK